MVNSKTMKNDPLRIAVVVNRFDSGGIETMLLNYYRHFDRSKIQYDIFYNENSSIPQYDELKSLGAGLYPIPSYSKPLAYQKALIKVFEEHDYKIAHVQVNTMSVFALRAAEKAGVPIRICHAHARGNKAEGLRYALKLLLRPFNTIYATHLLACGEDSGRWMFGNRPFTHIPNAVETGRFAFSAEVRKEVRREFGIPEDAFVIGNVGRFILEKNHGFLLEIQKQIPDAYLLLVGEGKLSDEINGERVIKTGARADVEKMYSAMDVFCMPSLSEGLPVVIIEAQANGLPCLCSEAVTGEADIGGITYCSLNDSPEVWAGTAAKLKRASLQIPEKWNIAAASKKLEDWYLKHNGYVSAYLRNVDEGPACFYRFGQYVEDLKTAGVNIKINNAYSRRQYRNNFDISSRFIKKAYQGLLYLITVINRTRQLNYDLKYHPNHVFVQRELVPKHLPRFLLFKLEKLDNIIWDFDDDIRARDECSLKEFETLKKKSEKIIVTNDYLNTMVDGKAILLPTTDGFAKYIDIENLIEKRKETFFSDFKTLWLGSFSNLSNLDLVDIPNLRVVCNRPYDGNVINIKWSRETAENELLNAHLGIMPLKDELYNYGKGAFKLIQYMSVGLPVIASSVGYNKEVVKSDFGVFDDFNISGFASDINRWEMMSKAAYNEYKDKYSYERVLNLLISVLG